MTISKSEFLEIVRKSRVLSDQQLQFWSGNSETDGMRIANQMVRDKVLTPWQAKYLLTGRHQLEIGPYRLLERTQRDELGDRFSAIHLQLGRNVDLQMLSAALSKDQTLYQAFIERVGQTSRLDHPNLSHVYDVDKVSGRYYLVTEHVSGARFADLSGSILNLASVAEWLSQAISGLRAIHANGLVHGDLRLEDLMLDSEHGVKIQNLAVTDLRNPLETKSGTPRSALDDWKSLGKIFQGLSKQLAGTHSSAQQTAWEALLQSLSNWPDGEPIDQIEQQITSLRTKLKAEVVTQDLGLGLHQIHNPSLEEELEIEYVTKTPSVRNRARSASNTESKSGLTPSKASSGSELCESDEDSNLDDGWFARLAVNNPVGLLSSAFVIGLMLAGTLTYLSLGPDPERSLAEADVNFKHEMPKQKTLIQTSLKQDSPEAKAASLSSMDQINPEAFISQLEQAEQVPSNSKPPAADHATQSAALPSAAATVPAVAKDGLVSATPVETQTVRPAVVDQPIVTPSIQPLAPEPAQAQPAATEPPPELALAGEQLQKKMENPFGQMAKQVSLPATSDTVEVKLGEVFIDDRFLMGAEVVVNPAISTHKIHFEAERDGSSNQRWLINISRTPRDKQSAIAVIRRESQEVFFQWLPEAKNNRRSGWLKNCLLKLFTPEQSILLPLRTSVEIAPLVLSAENLSAEAAFELDYLPRPDCLLVEVLPVEIEDTRLQPSVIDLKGIPGRVLLKREDDKATVWVNLSLDLKAKSVLSVDLVATDGVRLQPLKNLQELQAIASQWKQQELLLTQQVGVAEATPAPRGQGEEKDRFIAELNRQKKSAVSNATKFQQYVDLAPKMMGQPYGIRIVARYDGVDVELARTLAVSQQ
jgi:serine/threonine protein kinase